MMNVKTLWAVLCFPALLMTLPAAAAAQSGTAEKWLVDYIDRVPPIVMKEPFLELLGQTGAAVPYTYRETVKLTGHSCGAVAGAWTITRKALEALYPGAVPVRGQIRVAMPGAEDEWFVGVFGQVIGFVTGAAPRTGFPGAEFGREYSRRGLMTYPEKPAGTPPPKMAYVFERTDTAARVAVKYDLGRIRPAATQEHTEMGAKVSRGSATPAEAREWQDYWNTRARFVLENPDEPGLFSVEKLR